MYRGSSNDEFVLYFLKASCKLAKWSWNQLKNGKLNLHISDGMIIIEHPEYSAKLSLPLPKIN